jgi:hypothetical protein
VILTHKNGASFYRFENLARFSEIRHGIFTRHFGCSPEPFDSLNVSFGLGDKAAHVRENRRVIARAMRSTDMIYAQQVHGDQVLILNPDHFVSDQDAESVLGTGDALVTNAPGKFLTNSMMPIAGSLPTSIRAGAAASKILLDERFMSCKNTLSVTLQILLPVSDPH